MSRLIVITGASRGIGLELCKIYEAQGDKVVAICRQITPELQTLKLEIVSDIDLKAADAIPKICQILNDRAIDILINCAGILHYESLTEMNYANIEEQIEVNAIAPLKVSHALVSSLKHNAKIAIITSRMGSIDDNTSGAYYGYRMSKAAVNMAGKTLANDLKPSGIAVGLLHPGFVKTRMTNYNGDSTPEESAQNLYLRIEELNLQNTGSFRHANGQTLPW